MRHVSATEWPALLATASKVTGDRFRLYGRDGSLLIDSWRMTGPTYQLRDPKTEKWTKDVGPGARSRVQPSRRREIARRICRAAGRSAAGVARGGDRIEARQAGQRGPQCARPDAGDFVGGARSPAACCLRPTTTAPSRRQSAGSAAGSSRDGAVGRAFGLAVDVPRAHHRKAAAPARDSRSPGAPRAGRARCNVPRLPDAKRRDRAARPRCVRHEPVAEAADRQYRGVRRRRDPRAQEPPRLASICRRRPRPGRRSRASRSA